MGLCCRRAADSSLENNHSEQCEEHPMPKIQAVRRKAGYGYNPMHKQKVQEEIDCLLLFV